MTKDEAMDDWPDYLKRAMEAARIDSASELARRTGIGESLISRWLRGQNQPDIPNLRKLSPVLRRPLLALMVAAGHLTPAEARVREVHITTPDAPVTPAAAIDTDEYLSRQQKDALLAVLAQLQGLSERGDNNNGKSPRSETGS